MTNFKTYIFSFLVMQRSRGILTALFLYKSKVKRRQLCLKFTVKMKEMRNVDKRFINNYVKQKSKSSDKEIFKYLNPFF